MHILTDTLVFDNTFSRFRSKVLRYKVNVDTMNETEGLSQQQSNGKNSSACNKPGATKTENTACAGSSGGSNSDVESTSL